MSDIAKKREFVIGMYPGSGWKKKVLKMSDAQIAVTFKVVAIYLKEQSKKKEN